VISVGGSIRIRLSGRPDEFTPIMNLPAEPFEVRAIYLYRNPHVNDQDLARLAELQNLAVLHLDGTRITDAGLFHLRNITSLRDLSLRYCEHLSDAGIGHLKDLRNLDRLWLYATPISNDGLTHIKELKNLTSLDVGYTRVTEEGLDHLLELKNLIFLHIGGDKITDNGLARLRELRMLKYLDINGNPITDTGLSYLRELPDLEWLNLAETPITDAGLIHLKDIKKLTRLDFRKNKGLTDLREPLGNITEMLAQLSDPNWDRLEALSITAQPVPNLGFLRGITTLTELGLMEAKLSDQILSQFPRLPKLKKLVLDGNEVGTSGVGHLVAAVTQLEELSLAHTLCDTPIVLQLTELKELRVLNLAGTAVNDNSVKELVKLSKLEILDLRKTRVSTQGFAELQKALPKCQILWEETK